MKSVVISLTVIYGLVCLAAFLFQKKLIYFPGPAPTFANKPPGYPVDLTTPDGVLIAGWFVPTENPRGTIILCHGNAGNLEGRLPKALAFTDMGWEVLLFDYRGYGQSDGSPSEEGTYQDAVAAYDWVTRVKNPASQKIVAYGESLGAAVAMELAVRRPCQGLILDSGFQSVPLLARGLYPWLPTSLLLRIHYKSIEKIGGFENPVLVIHSPDDEVIPFHHGRALFEAASEPKTFVETRGGHNSGGILIDRHALQQTRDFLNQTIP